MDGDTLSGERAFILGGAAFTPSGGGGGGSAPAWLAQAGLGWEWPRWGLAARLGALYAERRHRGVDAVPGCGSRCTRSNRWFVAGALAEGSFDVRRTRNLRPFLSAGLGAVQSDIKERVGYMCNPLTQTCVLTDGSTLAYSDERASLALTGGAGFETRVWRANLLGEARVLWRSNRGGAPATMLPVTLGLRF